MSARGYITVGLVCPQMCLSIFRVGQHASQQVNAEKHQHCALSPLYGEVHARCAVLPPTAHLQTHPLSHWTMRALTRSKCGDGVLLGVISTLARSRWPGLDGVSGWRERRGRLRLLRRCLALLRSHGQVTRQETEHQKDSHRPSDGGGYFSIPIGIAELDRASKNRSSSFIAASGLGTIPQRHPQPLAHFLRDIVCLVQRLCIQQEYDRHCQHCDAQTRI